MPQAIEFRPGRVDAGDGRRLERAMAAEIAVIYPGLVIDAPDMPKAGPAELGPPGGAFLVGYRGDEAICCGGIKDLGDGACEVKRMYVLPAARGAGVARELLAALEDAARGLGYAIARLDTGPAQESARRMYEQAGYAEIANFNANPMATFFGEKRLA